MNLPDISCVFIKNLPVDSLQCCLPVHSIALLCSGLVESCFFIIGKLSSLPTGRRSDGKIVVLSRESINFFPCSDDVWSLTELWVKLIFSHTFFLFQIYCSDRAAKIERIDAM